MGIAVRLEEEDGEPVSGYAWITDRGKVFHKYLGLRDPSLPFVGFIDWYGITAFNGVHQWRSNVFVH